MTANRVNPLASLDDFAPKPTAKPIKRAEIDKLAEEVGFPSRQAPSPSAPPAAQPTAGRPVRRYTTGRNQQINIKATGDTIAHLTRLADELKVSIAEAFEQAVAALDAEVEQRRRT